MILLPRTPTKLHSGVEDDSDDNEHCSNCDQEVIYRGAKHTQISFQISPPPLWCHPTSPAPLLILFHHHQQHHQYHNHRHHRPSSDFGPMPPPSSPHHHQSPSPQSSSSSDTTLASSTFIHAGEHLFHILVSQIVVHNLLHEKCKSVAPCFQKLH